MMCSGNFQGYFIAGEKGEYEKVTGQEAREIERNKGPKPGARLQSLHFTQSCRAVLFRMPAASIVNGFKRKKWTGLTVNP